MIANVVVFSLLLTTITGTEIDVIRTAVTDWLECGFNNHFTSCLEERTAKSVREINVDMMQELNLDKFQVRRTGKVLNKTTEVGQVDPIEIENENLLRKIQERKTEPRGIIDDISDMVSYVTFKVLSPFSGDSSEEDETDNEEVDNEVDNEDGKTDIEERGHKKKELKKKNKKLKLILLLMLIKNKIKMVINKLQFLVQLKFLLVATVNMLANVIRLWIELKKKHKPNKVVYYENAHHQHHYDHEHIHDHDDGHYVHPGSYSHHAHHEEEDYGGGPWPWSRSHTEKQGEQTYQSVHPYRRYPGSHSIVYHNQRPLR